MISEVCFDVLMFRYFDVDLTRPTKAQNFNFQTKPV